MRVEYKKNFLLIGYRMPKEYIAMQGDCFTIEWYYDSKGKIPALEYFEGLSNDQKDALEYMFRVMAFTGQIRNKEKFRHEGDQIYAFKPKPDRFLCFFYKCGKIIVTNAFEKKTDKLPPREKDKALKAEADNIKRCKEGTYYDEKNQINQRSIHGIIYSETTKKI